MEPWIREVVEHHIKDLHNSREESAQETVDTVIIKTAEHEKAIALKALKQTPAFVRASTYEYLLIWDKKHSFSSSIPTLMIQASNPFCREGNARTVFSRLQVGRVVGSGPWVNLEVPLQAQSMIDRFLEI